MAGSGYKTGLAQVALEGVGELTGKRYQCVYIDPSLAKAGMVIETRHRDPGTGSFTFLTRMNPETGKLYVVKGDTPWTGPWRVTHDAKPSKSPSLETKARVNTVRHIINGGGE